MTDKNHVESVVAPTEAFCGTCGATRQSLLVNTVEKPTDEAEV